MNGVPQLLAGQNKKLTSREVALFGLLASLALIFGYLEVLFPLPIPVPGIKLGLGNIVVLFTLLGFGWRSGLIIVIIKVSVSSLLFGNPAVFVYSLAGGLLSFLVMWAATAIRGIGVTGISMAGGVAHIVGQLMVVSLVLAPYVALTYAPVLIIAGLATGALTGWLCLLVIQAQGNSGVFAERLKQQALQKRMQQSN
ncbi:MAG: Gx transporter family protein [Coriobacteriales bacterium]|nr:Gx transporter family protein [Coriobacteriales bacterium]